MMSRAYIQHVNTSFAIQSVIDDDVATLIDEKLHEYLAENPDETDWYLGRDGEPVWQRVDELPYDVVRDIESELEEQGIL